MIASCTPLIIHVSDVFSRCEGFVPSDKMENICDDHSSESKFGLRRVETVIFF